MPRTAVRVVQCATMEGHVYIDSARPEGFGDILT